MAIIPTALCAGAPAICADSPTGHDIQPLASVNFAPDEDVKCLSAATSTGDPATGAATFLLKAQAGCLVDWHYHTAAEQLMVIRGTVLTEMTGHPATLLGAGGFAVMGGMAPHRFVCQGNAECLMFVAFDGKYDIFWGKRR
jgi:quercetin dioxygenase-like cupin family protein